MGGQPTPRWDFAVAAATGYSDQAHLTREFVRFVGVGPTAWLAEEFRNIQDGGHAHRPEWSHDHREDHHPDRLGDPAGT